MWPHVLPPHTLRDACDRFVIAAHHPDRLRRPTTSSDEERSRQALIWNTFRTLELITPSFWLRRLHLRLTGEPSLLPPQIARVRLWHRLSLPPIQRIDGERPDVIVDVVVETEHAVWTLLADAPRNDPADSERMAAVVDAGTWFAGARHHHCGVIESGGSGASVGALLRCRYLRSPESARLRSATRGPAAPGRVQWGALQWQDLEELMQECREASTLTAIERALAGHALEWLARTR